MTTTIQVRDITRQRLEHAKQKQGVRSFDAVISGLLKDEIPSPREMFGKNKMKPWTKKDRMRFRNE